MGSLYKVNGTYYAKWFINGKRFRKTLKTTSIMRARALLKDIEDAINEGRPVGYTKDIEVESFTKLYLAHIKATKRPHTIKTLAHTWGQFVAWAKPLRLGDVTQETISNYKAYLLAEEYAKSTVRSNLLALSSVFNAAINDMHVLGGSNPCRGVKLPKPDEAFPRYLELAEIDKLLDQAKAHSRDLYLVVALGVFAGLRKNEIANATWAWIDLKGRGRVLVQSGGAFKTKSGRPRRIPLSARLRAILEPLKPDNGAQYIVYPKKLGKESAHQYRADFSEAFATVARRAELTDVTLHTLRHTFASQLAISGVSIYKISQWLGHTKIETTAIYSHLSPDDADIDRFGQVENIP